MKHFLFLALAALTMSAFAQTTTSTTTETESVKVYKLRSGDGFEVGHPGCMWSKEAGRCVVQNQFGVPIHCTVEISATTISGYRLGNTRHIRIDAYKYDDSARVFSVAGDELANVTAQADCTIE